MQAEQIELFELTETDILKKKIFLLESQISNLRKGIFVRHDTLFKMYVEMKNELEDLRKIVAPQNIEPLNCQRIPFKQS
ncbi:MAG: hypothetical protein LLG04_18950 [Parachlamydia sp.]|jgi:hypothetical protein|nr:hypothetical protein [Parachlamydia sp.]